MGTALLALTLGIVGCAAPNIWARPGVSAYQTKSDEESCLAIAEGRGPSAPGYSDGSVSGQIGAGVAGGAVDTITKLRARDACIAGRGYTRLTITSEEMSRLRALRGADDTAYQQQLLEKYGVVQASGTATPPR